MLAVHRLGQHEGAHAMHAAALRRIPAAMRRGTSASAGGDSQGRALTAP